MRFFGVVRKSRKSTVWRVVLWIGYPDPGSGVNLNVLTGGGAVVQVNQQNERALDS
jgi:hypothetical protein